MIEQKSNNFKKKKINKLKFYFSIIKTYKKKLIQILFFEIINTIKFGDTFYKIHNSDVQTDSLPCPYYFLRKISKFINVKKFYKELLKFKLTKKEDLNFGNPTIKSKSKFYDIILDDLFVPTLNPANYYEIKKDLKNFGFKIVRENKIIKRLDHDLLYPDYPLKKEHIVFDVIKKNATKKKFNTLYKVSNVESKIVKNIKNYNLSNKVIKKLLKIVISKKIYNNKLFLFHFINLYKSCHLLSVSNLTGVQKHIAFQKNVESIIKRFQN